MTVSHLIFIYEFSTVLVAASTVKASAKFGLAKKAMRTKTAVKKPRRIFILNILV
jgi:hypothetical protein